MTGVGFTMSLFIGSLAFEEQGLAYQTSVKVGVLLGSLVSAVLGAILLARSNAKSKQRIEADKQTTVDAAM